MAHPLLGNSPSRNYKIYRTEFPAIFRFDGKLFMELYGLDEDSTTFVEIQPETAERWLRVKE